MRLGRIGFDHVVGYLEDGMESLAGRDDLVAATERIPVQDLSEQLPSLTVLDVRNEKEWRAAHIAGSVNIPLNQLSERIDELPSEGSLAVHCQSGYRSSVATSLLKHRQRTDVMDVVGGSQAWTAFGLPFEEESAQPA